MNAGMRMGDMLVLWAARLVEQMTAAYVSEISSSGDVHLTDVAAGIALPVCAMISFSFADLEGGFLPHSDETGLVGTMV